MFEESLQVYRRAARGVESAVDAWIRISPNSLKISATQPAFALAGRFGLSGSWEPRVLPAARTSDTHFLVKLVAAAP